MPQFSKKSSDIQSIFFLNLTDRKIRRAPSHSRVYARFQKFSFQNLPSNLCKGSLEMNFITIFRVISKKSTVCAAFFSRENVLVQAILVLKIAMNREPLVAET